jgi:hypothetical protein
LATNPNISTIGERRKFHIHSLVADENNKMKCSCGELFKDCEYWSTIKNIILTKVTKADLVRNATEFQLFANKHLNKIAHDITIFFLLSGTNIIPFKDRIEKLNAFNLLLVESILDLDNNEVFLDSSKTISHVLFLSLIEKLDLHVVWLTRDPRAQINSAIKYNKYSVTKASKLWVNEMKQNEAVLEKRKIKYFKLRYEDLCENTDQKMRDLMTFFGLDKDSYSLNFRDRKQHIMGNFAMRLGSDKKIEVRNEWRNDLTDEEVKKIEKLTKSYEIYNV